MKLNHFPNTRSARVVWTAFELGEELDTEIINLQKGEHKTEAYLSTNPYGWVPVARLGDATLIESGGICLTLIEQSDNGDKLLPAAGSAERARCYSLAFHAPAILDDITIPTYLQLRFTPEDKRDKAMIEKNLAVWRDTAAPYLSGELGDQTWFCGDQFTFADIMVGYDLFFAQQLDVLGDHHNLQNYVGRWMQREAFGESFSLG